MAGGYFGVYRGTVVNNADPERRGRLILQAPSVLGFRQTTWAEAVHPSGFPAIPPKPGDPVWVMFDAGDTSAPVWMGIPGATTVAGGSTGVSFSDVTITGNLTFGATGDYLVPGGNRYAFRYAPAPNYGLLFNDSAGAFQFTNGSAASVFSIDANGGTSTATGAMNIDTAFIGRWYDGNYAAFKNKNTPGGSAYAVLHSGDGNLFLNSSNAGKMFFRHENTSRMVLDGTGLRIGDDATAPIHRLEALGTGWASTAWHVGTDRSGPNTALMKWVTTGTPLLSIDTWGGAHPIRIGGSYVSFQTESGSYVETYTGKTTRILNGKSAADYGTTSQLSFGWSQGTNYQHSIRTRHQSNSTTQNAIDFYVWTPGHAVGAESTSRIFTVDGAFTYSAVPIALGRQGPAANWAAWMNLASYQTDTPNVTGAIVFTAPYARSTHMQVHEFVGYNYGAPSTGAYSFRVSFYNFTDGDFYNHSVEYLSEFKPRVRVAYAPTTGNVSIIVGETNVVWAYPKLTMTRSWLGHTPADEGFHAAGWTASITTDISGYTSQTDFANRSLSGSGTNYDASLVHLAGAETITGAKTLTASPLVQTANPTWSLSDGTNTGALALATTGGSFHSSASAGDMVVRGNAAGNTQGVVLAAGPSSTGYLRVSSSAVSVGGNFLMNGTDNQANNQFTIKGTNSQAALAFNQNGASQWYLYQAGLGPIYLRDMTNARMQVAYTAGASVASALTDFASNVNVQGTITASGISTTGTLLEGANRVYSAGNPPPDTNSYPTTRQFARHFLLTGA